MREIDEKVMAKIPLSSAERAAWLQWMGLEPQPSSSSRGERRKKRKRRKKKLPKASSSSFLHGLRGAGDQGIMFEYAEEENEVAGYSGRAETAPCMNEMGKFMEEKVISQEETILKNGAPALSLYVDRTHTYIAPSKICGLAWRENRHRYVWRLGCYRGWTGLLLTFACGQVCYAQWVEQTLSDTPSDKTVKALTWLLFDDSSDLGLQLGRANAVPGRINRMIKLGHLNIDDDDKGLGDDDDQKFKTMCPRMKSCMAGCALNSLNSAGSWSTARSLLRFSARPRGGWWGDDFLRCWSPSDPAPGEIFWGIPSVGLP